MSATVQPPGKDRRHIWEVAERMVLAARLKVLQLSGLCDVDEAVDVVLLLTERLFRDAGVTVVRRSAGGTFYVRAVMGRLEQVLVNILLNACEATPRHGSVTVVTGYRPDEDGNKILRASRG